MSFAVLYRDCSTCHYFELADGDTGNCMYLHKRPRPFWLSHASPLLGKQQGTDCMGWTFDEQKLQYVRDQNAKTADS
jgi:hypothetical protein